MMPEPAEDTIVHNLIEALERLRQDLDRVELWTAALGCFQRPVPEYEPNNRYLLSSKSSAKSDRQKPRPRVRSHPQCPPSSFPLPYTGPICAHGVATFRGENFHPNAPSPGLPEAIESPPFRLEKSAAKTLKNSDLTIS